MTDFIEMNCVKNYKKQFVWITKPTPPINACMPPQVVSLTVTPMNSKQKSPHQQTNQSLVTVNS